MVEKELNPVSCALIRADTAVLFIIVSMMHKKKRKKIKHCKFPKTKKKDCLKHLYMNYLVSLKSSVFVSVSVSVT